MTLTCEKANNLHSFFTNFLQVTGCGFKFRLLQRPHSLLKLMLNLLYVIDREENFA